MEIRVRAVGSGCVHRMGEPGPAAQPPQGVALAGALEGQFVEQPDHLEHPRASIAAERTAGRAVRTLLAKLLRGVVGADIPCLTAVIREALLHFSGPQS